MPPVDPTRRLAFASRARTLVLLVFIFFLAGFAGVRFSKSLQGADFPDFYCAARMLAEGHGRQLYDAELQRQYQSRYTGRVGTLYIHPPFEAALYLTVGWLPLRSAYLLWFFLNLVFVATGVRRITREALPRWDWRLLLAASLTFVPLLLCLQQGQDSLLLLLLVIFGFTALRQQHVFAAGCWLGLGLFKFEILAPLALLLILSRSKNARNAFATGFSLVAVTLAGLSAAISGWSVFRVYPMFLLHLQAQPFAGIHPLAMANFRGLAYFFFRNDQSSWAVAAVTILSVAALVDALVIWRRARPGSEKGPASRNEFDLAFACTVLLALLVSYHLNPHDLSLLLVPIFLLLHRVLAEPPLPRSGKWMVLSLLAGLFLPPLHICGLRAGVYALVSLPLLAVFLAVSLIAPRLRKS